MRAPAHGDAQGGVPESTHYSESPRTGMPRSLHFPSPAHARIHTFLPIPAHDRAQKGECGLQSHVQRGLRLVEAGPAIARSMSPSDQDVSTTPAMRRCNSSRSPFVSGSLHFYRSPRTGGPRSLHFLRARRPDRPGPSRGGCPDPCIFTGPDAGRRRNPSTGATPGAVAPRPASAALSETTCGRVGAVLGRRERLSEVVGEHEDLRNEGLVSRRQESDLVTDLAYAVTQLTESLCHRPGGTSDEGVQRHGVRETTRSSSNNN